MAKISNRPSGLESTIQAVDLFCGAGGLTRGLLNAGIEVRAGIDLENDCRYAYEHNNRGVVFVNKSVEDISESDLAQYFDESKISLLCGCAPCQAFSSLNQRNEDRRQKKGRWVLLDEFSRLVGEIKPDLVSMENVPGLANQDVFLRFTESLKTAGYHIDYRIIDCSDYGMPQKRLRLVLVASKLGEISLPKRPKNQRKRTVKDAIAHLPKIRAGEKSSIDELHCASALSKDNLRRIKSSKPGGTWRDWDEDLRLPCHKEETGDGYGAVYGRMSWDEPSPTITTQFYNYGSGRFGHPEQNRALSLREGAILQGFPADYQFHNSEKPLGKRTLGALIGNAVPVGLGELVGNTLIQHVANQSDKSEASNK